VEKEVEMLEANLAEIEIEKLEHELETANLLIAQQKNEIEELEHEVEMLEANLAEIEDSVVEDNLDYAFEDEFILDDEPVSDGA
jgi:predicted  nucleic acid-binding Zn-ribbon protein